MPVISWIRDLFRNQENREHKNPEYQCLDKCMENLSPREREIVLTGAWARGNKVAKIHYRRELAARLGITYTDVISDVPRIKAKLEQCVRKCLNESTRIQHKGEQNGT